MATALSTPDVAASVDDRLSFFDQAALLEMRATGRDQLMLGVWIYERPVDMAGLRRFHRDFGYGLWGRLIEPSSLPFGRYRWVSASGPSAPLAVAEIARPREELSDWVDERMQSPVDPEHGPGWHLGVQPFTDGSTAVCLVASHCLGDGIGAAGAIFAAVTGTGRDLGYPLPGSRTRWRGRWDDLAGAVRALPEAGRALAAGVRLAVRRRHDILGTTPPPSPSASAAGEDRDTGGDEIVVVPATTLFVTAADWDARAAALGGTSYALVAGFTARLAERLERRSPDDGSVRLLIAQSQRTLDDTRAQAMAIVSARVDPAPVRHDLAGLRAAVRQAMDAAKQAPDETLQLLPLVPFVPKRVVKALAGVFLGSADLPVACSNVGELPPEIACIDGTPADYLFQRGVDHNMTRAHLERERGQLVVVSSRSNGRIAIDVVGYQPGAANTKAWLREVAATTLAEFELTAVVI